MRYIVSDIHGCYDQYRALLEKIHFSDGDELYVLGDVVDHGPKPIKVLQDMMERPNVIFILGNHDFVMYSLMKTLAVEITEENYDKQLSADIMRDFNLWLSDGGGVTAEQFRELEPLERADYTKRYYPQRNIFLVTGHTPTVFINGWGKPEVYRKHGHIALDCACVSGGKLAAFCVETEEVIYVDGL